MSKEFESAVKALRAAGDALRSAGDALGSAGDAFVHIAEVIELRTELKADRIVAEQTETQVAPANEPEPVAKLTKADVKKLLVSKSRAGYTDQVKDLLTKYGASNITGLKDDQLEAFYKEAEVIGNAG